MRLTKMETRAHLGLWGKPVGPRVDTAVAGIKKSQKKAGETKQMCLVWFKVLYVHYDCVNVRNVQTCGEPFMRVYWSQTNNMLGSKFSNVPENNSFQLLLCI